MKRLFMTGIFFLLITNVVGFTGKPDIFSWSETNDMGKPYTTFLGQNNVINNTAASGTMKIISEQGRYYLREDMHISPANTDVTCLKITSSNVIVDLRGYTIMGNTTTGAGMIGIEVASNLSNIQIVNGTISAMNGTGIKVNTGCNDVQLHNIKIDNCTLVGITMNTCTDIHLYKLIVTRCDGSHASASDGAVGLRLATCKRVRISGSHFDGNWNASTGDAMGVYVSNSTHCEFVDCSALSNKAGTDPGDAAYGFRIASSSSGAVFKGCVSGHNTSQDGPAYGYSIDASNSVMMECCSAHSNTAAGTDAGTDDSYGFSFSENAGSAYLKNCFSNNNTGAANVYGFSMNNCDYNYLLNCQARNQTTSSSAAVNVYGFYSTAGQGNTFRECRSLGNVGATHSSANTAGYCFAGSEKYSNILFCASKANNGNTGLGYGIWLSSATYCTIRGNELFVNVGTANGYGIKDDASSSVSAYFENFAYGNGSSDGLKVNNFDVKLSPNDSVDYFPVQEAFLTDFTSLKQLNTYDNVELIERADTSAL